MAMLRNGSNGSAGGRAARTLCEELIQIATSVENLQTCMGLLSTRRVHENARSDMDLEGTSLPAALSVLA
ncbi:MAG: hypothetical protein JOZ15_19585 [Acidobacteria bacterium]|nr:hypothetical protein [Acidobacteriota bacterium]